MNRKKLALCVPVHPADLEKIQKYCDITKAGALLTGRYDLTEEEVYEQCKGNEIIVTENERSGAQTLKKWKDAGLKLMISARGTPTVVDWKAVKELEIPLAYLPGRNSVAVAEYTLGLMLMLAKKMHLALYGMHDGKYPGPEKADIYDYVEKDDVNYPMDEGSPFATIGMGTELYGKTVGILGYGAIGRKVAHLCQAFHMDVLAYDPYFSAETMKQEGVTPCKMEEVFEQSDILSIHLPVNEETRGMIDERYLERMKPSAYLINTARAAVLSQRAVVRALQSGWIRGAAMDVTWEEPIPKNHPLLLMDNVIITPHMGAMTEEIEQIWTSRMITEHILNYCTGKPITTLWTRTER